MHVLPGRAIVFVVLLATLFASGHDLPQSFVECVVRGGSVTMEGSDITCRYVETTTLRTYLTGTTECGETLTFDAWGETKRGVLTYMFDPALTEVLPEVRDDGIPVMPMPCLRDPDATGD